MNVSKQSSNAGHKLKIDDMSEEILLIDLTDDESARVNGGLEWIGNTCYYNNLYEYSLCLSTVPSVIGANPATVTPTDFGVG